MPGSGGVAHRTPVDLPTTRVRLASEVGVAVAAVLLALWFAADVRTPDLAAAAYRLDLFRHLGFAVWDEHWYGGHHLPGYSLLFPPLASLLGLRLLGVLSVLASVALFARLSRAVFGPSARWGAMLFALAAVGDVWIGRLAFALGVPLALAAVLVLVRGRALSAGVLAASSAAASPVAGALLALAGFTHALWSRSPRATLALAAPAATVIAALALLFPEGGSEPYPILSFAATAVVVIAFCWALPPALSLLRVGGVLYLSVCLLCLLIPTPMGSNVERYGVLLAGPLLVCALLSMHGKGWVGDAIGGERRDAGEHVARARLTPAVAVALVTWAAWVGWGPVRETLAVAGDESTSASYYAPVERFLRAHASAPVRLEVPLTRSHWEAALLAPTVSLARGWEKQLDKRFDRVLLAPRLTADAYRRWLDEQAVGYVALPDTALDPSSAREGRLIRSGLPYLREVFVARHWRIYRVLSATPLAAGPGQLTSLGHDSFTLRARSPGSFLVHVRFTRYWGLARGVGCVRQAAGGWTSVVVRAPGTVVVDARFSLSRALGLTGSCRR
jgi:hypothetical protein